MVKVIDYTKDERKTKRKGFCSRTAVKLSRTDFARELATGVLTLVYEIDENGKVSGKKILEYRSMCTEMNGLK